MNNDYENFGELLEEELEEGAKVLISRGLAGTEMDAVMELEEKDRIDINYRIEDEDPVGALVIAPLEGEMELDIEKSEIKEYLQNAAEFADKVVERDDGICYFTYNLWQDSRQSPIKYDETRSDEVEEISMGWVEEQIIGALSNQGFTGVKSVEGEDHYGALAWR